MVAQNQKVTRRRFNQGMLGVGAAALAAPAFLRGQSLNSKLNIAIIGRGRAGRKIPRRLLPKTSSRSAM